MEELVERLRTHAKSYEEMFGEGESSVMMRDAADAIEELSRKTRELPRWIPVTERLPEFEGAVLCMRKSNVYGVRPYQEILYVDEYGFKNYDDIYLADGVVTHWMQLPQPPEGE